MTTIDQTRPDPTAPPAGSEIFELVAGHLGADPTRLPMLTERFRSWESVNVQVALDAYIAGEGRSARAVGVSSPAKGHLAALVGSLAPSLAGVLAAPESRIAGIEYERLDSGPGEQRSCIRRGLLLIDGPGGPVAAWVREYGRRPNAVKAVDVLAPTVEAARAFLADLKALMSEHNVFRGQYIQLRSDGYQVHVGFEAKPDVARDEVILPDGVLDAIEDHAVGIGRLAGELAAAGRHLKRGLLLYGPPGTGKTHTIRYLASQLPDATLFVMTGSGMAWLDMIKEMSADLAPAIVVLDDVDLIAEDRSLPGMAPRQLLFSLLDAMDGMRDDADILFVCTSNRADTLEKAVAARPGRIDHAVEIGVPDADGRARLLDLYARRLALDLADREKVIERTEGVTASFMKELLRRAYLRARAAGVAMVIDEHVHGALDVLLDPDNPITPSLLGVDESVLRRQKSRGSGTAWCGI